MNTTRIAASLPVLLASANAPATAAVTNVPAPPVREFDGTRYVAGGVGVEERDVLRRTARPDDLQLVFARKDGHYLADVDVSITDPKGHPVLQTTADGPWLFTELPRGTYVITAAAEGRSGRQRVQVVPGRQRQVAFSL